MAILQKHIKHSNLELVEDASLLVLSEVGPQNKTGETGDPFWSRPVARIWTLVLLIGTCLLYCARVAMPICAVAMADQFKWSKKESGIALGSFFWGYCLTQVLGGYISDRVGGEKVLLLSATAWGCLTAFTPMIAHISSVPLLSLTLSRFLTGLLQGVHFPSLASLFSQKVRENERAFISSTVGTGSQFGTLVIGGAGSLLLEWYGWESVFYFSGFLSVVWAFFLWKHLLQGQGPIISLETLGSSSVQSKNTKVPWNKLFKKAPVWAVIIAHLCTGSTFFVLLSWLPTFFKDCFPDSKGWVFNVVPWLVAIPSSLFGGYLSDHLISLGFDIAAVRKLMQFFAMGVSSFFTLLLCRTTTFSMAITLVAATMGLQTFSHSGVSVNVQDLAPSCAGYLYGVVLVYFSGYLIDTTGSWASVFTLVSVLNLLGLFTFLVFAEARRVDIEVSKIKCQNIHL
ncbi:solute carrier family 17 member 9-like isoform X2 [Erpetoichthys calabaricus]|uniref:solute carrier family 17 member 9-like isoform X2 n=1 Tax=Erpetoichthys calabaricus TaxID=27687 RepID=UPI0010A013B4|nr:solute carrier family 17 member 9-like isoform X2 [Erpetoichthys calabaricus]